MNEKIVWYKISESRHELFSDSQGLTEVAVNGREICISVINEKLYACAAKCPHAGGRMAEGYVDPLGNIVCPLHRYKFSVENGRNMSGEGYFLKTFLIEERKEGVFVGIEEKKGLFGL